MEKTSEVPAPTPEINRLRAAAALTPINGATSVHQSMIEPIVWGKRSLPP